MIQLSDSHHRDVEHPLGCAVVLHFALTTPKILLNMAVKEPQNLSKCDARTIVSPRVCGTTSKYFVWVVALFSFVPALMIFSVLSITSSGTHYLFRCSHRDGAREQAD